MITQRRWDSVLSDRSQEGGYVAVMTALMLTVLMGLCAFAVDVGHWYLVGQQAQRAADAAAMAGVTRLPGNPDAATTTARNYSSINGFTNGVSGATVTPSIDGRSTRLRVTVSSTVTNIFGSLLGVPTTTIGKTAVADYAGPVPMGSPCNRFGNNPDAGTTEATTCSGVLGEFWANVNSPKSNKQNGDAYQGNVCLSSVDGCSGSNSGPNSDYATDGYFYAISVKAAMSSLTIQLFDPVWVNTGLTCDTNFGSVGTRGIDASNDVVSDPTARYLPNTTSPAFYSPYCTGDYLFSGSQAMNTQFTVRDPSATPWDTSTFPVHATCQKTYPGYNGSLFSVLDQYTSGATPRSTYNKDSTGTVGPQTIVDGFRRWTTLCTIANPAVGDYLVQVKTNGLGTAFDNADATNHFGIRAFGADSNDKEHLSIFGREKMSIFANKPGVTTEFHLARIPSSAAGQVLRVRLFDVGDTAAGGSSGTINIIRPPDATGDAFSGCTGVLSTNAQVSLPTCSLYPVKSATHNGKWQTISVPIPANYQCTDADSAMCWVRLQYVYGSSTSPNDVTSWTASIEGDPVRLVE